MANIQSKFNIGDKVTPKQLGYPGIGQIIGVINGDHYERRLDCGILRRWAKLYPNWKKHLVYMVHFEKPMKGITEAEYKHVYPNDTPYELQEKHHEQSEYKYFSYPQDDLELFEAIDENYSRC